MTAPAVRPCTSCARDTRPPRALIADYPGTIVRWHAGDCDRCHRNGVRGGEVVQARMSIEEISAELARYLNKRRERISA